MADEEVERTRKILNETSFLANTPSTLAESFDVLDYSSDDNDDDFSNNGVQDDTEADNNEVNKTEEQEEEEEEDNQTDGINSFPDLN